MATFDLHLKTKCRASGDKFESGRFGQVSLSKKEGRLLAKFLEGSPIYLVERKTKKAAKKKGVIAKLLGKGED